MRVVNPAQLIFIGFFILFSSPGRHQAQVHTDTPIYGAADIIIKRAAFYYVNLPMNVLLSQKSIILKPRENDHWIKTISISYDSITAIKKVYAGLLITENNGTSHRLRLKRRKQLIEILKVKSHPENKKDRNYVVSENANQRQSSDTSRTSIWINCRGSTFYSPLIIKCGNKFSDSSLTFVPLNYTNYVKTVTLKKSGIKWIERKGKKRILIGMRTGETYTIRSAERNEIISSLQNVFTIQ